MKFINLKVKCYRHHATLSKRNCVAYNIHWLFDELKKIAAVKAASWFYHYSVCFFCAFVSIFLCFVFVRGTVYRLYSLEWFPERTVFFSIYLFTSNLVSFTVLTVSMSGKINEVAARNQHLFSRQQNFDRHGLFISTVFSMPILLNCMLMIVRKQIYSDKQFNSVRFNSIQFDVDNKNCFNLIICLKHWQSLCNEFVLVIFEFFSDKLVAYCYWHNVNYAFRSSESCT